MLLGDALLVLARLADAGVPHWVAGGWGVDALVGRQTREHRDLDLLVEAQHLDLTLRELARLGYQVETDALPVRVEVYAEGVGWVDVHPVRFGPDGHGVQAGPGGTSYHYPADCLVAGALEGHPVPCLSVTRQLEAHEGYPLRPHDERDVDLLRAVHRAPVDRVAAMPEGAAHDRPQITRDDVAHLAGLARIALSADELDRLAGELPEILDAVATVSEALEGAGEVEPMSHPTPIRNVTREDRPRPSLAPEEALAMAPAVEEQRFLVPKILGEA